MTRPPKRIIAYKLRPRDRELIERAAALEEVTLSELVRGAAIARARRIIRQHEEATPTEGAAM